MNTSYLTASFFNLGFLAKKNLEQLKKIEADVFELFSDMVLRNGGTVGDIKSQIGQDVFVLYSLNWKKGGYFLDFGATNGVDLSNTYLLEKDFGWKGSNFNTILVEGPSKKESVDKYIGMLMMKVSTQDINELIIISGDSDMIYLMKYLDQMTDKKLFITFIFNTKKSSNIILTLFILFLFKIYAIK